MNFDYASLSEGDLRELVGGNKQLASVRRSVLEDGRGRGVRIAEVNNGSGLSFTVALDRGMDLVEASFKGLPLAFLAPGGHCHPAFQETIGFGWLRTWQAGLMTTCGMLNAGPPDEGADIFSVGGPQGLHGRASYCPAANVTVEEGWKDGKFKLSVKGTLREDRMFGEHLRRERVIRAELGSNHIEISDSIHNDGFSSSPLMLIYHSNLGFPLLSPLAELVAVKHEITPRDDIAAAGIERWHLAERPTPGFREQCFLHDLPPGEDGMARISLRNSAAGLSFEVAYRVAELPNLMQWKMMGQGEYVMGLEPCNNTVGGRHGDEAKGTLRRIEPGETVETLVVFTVREL